VFVAEIGDITRFATAAQLACWVGLTALDKPPSAA
jgi:transposase